MSRKPPNIKNTEVFLNRDTYNVKVIWETDGDLPDAFLIEINDGGKTLDNNIFEFTIEGIPAQSTSYELWVNVCCYWNAPTNGFNEKQCSAAKVIIPTNVESPSPTPPNPAKTFPPPTITNLQSFPKTINSPSTVIVSWVAPRQYDVFEIKCDSGSTADYYSKDISGTASSGTHSIIRVLPRKKYEITVRGIYKEWEDWPWEKKRYSPWSAAQSVETAPPLISLRAFLQDTDASQGIRQFMPKDTQSLRLFISF